MNPPRVAEWLLRLVLSDRDRETISGDLLEEYRDAVLPARGINAAQWWYRHQVAGVLWRLGRAPLAAGALFGAGLGAWNLIETARHPLGEDDGASMLLGVAAVLTVWVAGAAAAAWRTRPVVRGLTAGVLLGVATLFVFHIAAVARVLVFVDTIQGRDDWQNLVARYHASGFATLRAYALYEYVRLTPGVLAIGAVAGAVSGAVGGAIAWVRQE
jgi:hypothetical protein